MISIHRYGFECPYLFVYGFAGLVDIGTVKIHRIDQAQIHQHFSGIDSSTAVAGFTGRNCRVIMAVGDDILVRANYLIRLCEFFSFVQFIEQGNNAYRYL